MNHIWIDVTTLVYWQRPAVGVVRTEQQLVQWLTANEQEGVAYCRYDRYSRQFYQLSAETVRAHLQRIAAYDVPETQGGRVEGTQSRLVQKARTFLARLPDPISQPLTAFLIRHRQRIFWHLHRFRLLMQRLSPKRLRHPLPVLPNDEPISLPQGAVYVSLGLDWDYKDMAHLYQVKKELGLKCLFFCYDTIPVKYPQLCVADVSRQFAHYFADLAWAADLILCISESSRRDLQALLQRLNVPLPELQVVCLGGDLLPGGTQEERTAQVSAATERNAAPYILFVSTIERRKNHEILYRAYTRLLDEGLALPDLIFVGMPGWGVQDLMNDLRLDPRVKEKIILRHHVSDAELATLYRGAEFTVYPSLYEGWGLPVGESLAFGKFCLCSNTSSLPEVGGDWVEYLDPWDLPAWVERLRYLLQHPEEVAARNARIAANYQPYPWRNTAQDIFAQARRLAAPGQCG